MRRQLPTVLAITAILALSLTAPPTASAVDMVYITVPDGIIRWDAGNLASCMRTWRNRITTYQLSASTVRDWLTDFSATLDAGITDPGRARNLRDAVRDLTESRAWTVIAEGRPGEAMVLARRLISREPSNPASFVILSEVALAANEVPEALQAAERGLELAPTSQRALVVKSRGLARMGRTRESLSFARRCVELHPDVKSSWEALLDCLRALNDNAEAYRILPGCLQRIPDEAGLWNRFAVLSYAYGDLSRAKDAVNKALEASHRLFIGVGLDNESEVVSIKDVRPGSPAATAGLQPGDQLLTIEGKDTARVPGLLTRVVAEGTEGSPIKLVVRRGRRRMNVTVLRGKTLRPDHELEMAEALAVRSLVCRAEGTTLQALRDAEAAMAALDTSQYAQTAKTLALFDMGRTPEALAVLQRPGLKSVARAPLNPFMAEHHIARTLVLAAAGNLAPAVEAFKTAKSTGLTGPDMPTLWKDVEAARAAIGADGVLAEARRLVAARQWAPAMERFRTALSLAATLKDEEAVRAEIFDWGRRQTPPPALPEEAQRLSIRSRILTEAKDFDKARAEIAAACELAPWEPSLCYNAAMVAAAAQRYGEAATFMQRYMAGAPGAPDAEQCKRLLIEWELLHERSLAK